MGYYHPLRGDPGFFSTLFKIGKGLLGIPSAAPPVVIEKAVPTLTKIGGAVGRMISKHPVLTAAGGAGAIAATGAVGMRHPSTMPGVGPHMGGAAAMGGRRRRRMRVTNPRALRRAIRRAQGFARLAKRVMHFISPRAPRGRAVFRAKRRKRV